MVNVSDMLLKVLKMPVHGLMKEPLKVQYWMVSKGSFYNYETFSFILFCSNYTVKMHSADEYFLSRFPIVNLRLAQGGVRLAATLNRIFDTGSAMSV